MWPFTQKTSARWWRLTRSSCAPWARSSCCSSTWRAPQMSTTPPLCGQLRASLRWTPGPSSQFLVALQNPAPQPGWLLRTLSSAPVCWTSCTSSTQVPGCLFLPWHMPCLGARALKQGPSLGWVWHACAVPHRYTCLALRSNACWREALRIFPLKNKLSVTPDLFSMIFYLSTAIS